MTISHRVRNVEPSATIDVIDHVKELEQRNIAVIDLASGDQTSAGSELFRTPKHVREAAIESLNRGETQLSPSAGLLELRELIARKFREDNGLDATADTVIVTPGTKFALFAAILSLVDEGDEVVLLKPSYVSFEHLSRLAGCTIEEATLDPASNFTLGDRDLEETVGPDTDLLIINTPLNPSGGAFPRSDLETVRDLALEYDFSVISDEIYEKLVFDGTHHSIATLDGMGDRTVTVNGLSKAYAMNGWRVGYLTGSAPVVRAIGKIHGNVASSIPIFSQYAAMRAIRDSEQIVSDIQDLLLDRRDILVDSLADEGIDIHEPAAGLYAFVPTRQDDDQAVATELITDAHVAVTPGSAFGVSGYIRLCYLLDPEELKTGVKRVAPYLESI